MSKRIIATHLLGLLLLGACSVPDNMKDFDSDSWKSDRNGCENKRAELVDDFELIRKELYGKKEYVVRNLLGKPDSEELMERSQRIYFYYIEPGDQCQQSDQRRTQMSEANRVQVRLNSVGKVSEVTYYRPVTAEATKAE